MTEPIIQVGILTGKEINFLFTGTYVEKNSAKNFTGEQTVIWPDGNMVFENESVRELYFEPQEPAHYFTLHDVTIGVDFHWERKENQSFKGRLKLLGTSDGIVVINEIYLEEYLVSVISSEMSATAGKEFLKAHAVISRSWLLAQLQKSQNIQKHDQSYNSHIHTKEEIIRWYDREDHLLFDVCADDHCQRYQGITRASLPMVEEVIRETMGEILCYDNLICDARFSKCCGGVSEQFEYCWEPVFHPYLVAVRDSDMEKELPLLTEETVVTKWIQESPLAFCNTKDPSILSQVLNNYDQETSDFYRWKVSYEGQELSRLIWQKSGIDFGEIIDLIPVKRGLSGRLEKLKIVGSKQTYIIGKELEIRRILSTSHLYSSAFIIEKEVSLTNQSVRFHLLGAGWGHGVGLCQIGAAVMGEKGYSYKEILSHYFKGAEVLKRY